MVMTGGWFIIVLTTLWIRMHYFVFKKMVLHILHTIIVSIQSSDDTIDQICPGVNSDIA